MIVGAHVRRRQGGIVGAFPEAQRRGAECLQLFVSNPRAWAGPRYTPEQVRTFREALDASGLRPCVAHLSYIGNVAAWNPEFLRRTRELLLETVAACDLLDVDLLVVHTGAGGPQPREAALRSAADTYRIGVDAAARVRVLAELMAGTSGAVASLPHEAEELFAAVDDDRLGLVVDTAHAIAAGVALDEPDGVTAFSEELHRRGLGSRLALVHANDSEFARGARRDRHTNIGDGTIGEPGWRALAGDPLLASVPWMLETPGDAERQAADMRHLRALGAGAGG